MPKLLQIFDCIKLNFGKVFSINADEARHLETPARYANHLQLPPNLLKYRHKTAKSFGHCLPKHVKYLQYLTNNIPIIYYFRKKLYKKCWGCYVKA